MKVVILCGGKGARIKEETEFRPKPMVTIGRRPILWHIMKYFSHYNFKDFILPLGYKGEQIKEYFYDYGMRNSDFTVSLGSAAGVRLYNNHSERDWTVTLVDTGLAALKGARLKRVERFVDGTDFLVTYGDGLSDVNMEELVRFHLSHRKIATVTGVHPPSRFGELLVEGARVKRFSEKPQTSSDYINGGFFVFNRRVFDYLEDRDDCDLECGLLETLSERGELMMYGHSGFWQCMDNIRDMDYLNSLWQRGDAPWKVWS